MEAEKSQDKLEARGIVPVQVWGLKTRRTHAVSSSSILSPKAEEDQCPSLKTSKESKFLFALPVCSIQAFHGLDEAHPHWGGQFALLGLPV